MTPRLAATPSLLALLASASAVRAEQPEAEANARERIAAPSYALESTLAAGYTQGFGEFEKGVGLRRVAPLGITFELGLGYRSTPRWALGVTGQYQEFRAERAAGAHGVTTGVAATYHVAPHLRYDPWVQFGAGYRILWEAHEGPEANARAHGFQLAKLAAGLDLRLSEDVGLSPVAGADLNVFLWQSGPGPMVIEDPRPSVFAFVGFQGRFDDFGVLREARSGAASSRGARALGSPVALGSP